jgi:hypothetical protein
VKRWDAFQFICATLRATLAAARPEIPADVDWPTVIGEASLHLVTPMLAPALVGHDAVPCDVQDYFAAVQTLTEQQARVLSRLSTETVSVLNGVDAQPVLLKGAAGLVQGIYPAPGVRLMTDIDVLVDSSKMSQANAALAARGYRQPKQAGLVCEAQFEPHHDPPLRHVATGIRIEIHRALADPAFVAVLPASEALRRAISVQARAGVFSVLAPTDRVTHHIMHAQLHHRGAERGIVDLRQLADLAILVDAYGTEIAWAEVEKRFAVNGYSAALAAYLTDLALLLDHRVSISSGEAPQRLSRLRASIEAPRKPSERLANIAREYRTRVKRRPRLLLSLLRLRLWPRRITRWRNSLRQGYF